jgi:hypothetical protein
MPEHDAQNSQRRHNAHDGCEKKEAQKEEIEHRSGHRNSAKSIISFVYSVVIEETRQEMNWMGSDGGGIE